MGTERTRPTTDEADRNLLADIAGAKATTTYRSAMFMQSCVDRSINDAEVRAGNYQFPSEFWRLMASEVALKIREAENAEDNAIARTPTT